MTVQNTIESIRGHVFLGQSGGFALTDLEAAALVRAWDALHDAKAQDRAVSRAYKRANECLYAMRGMRSAIRELANGLVGPQILSPEEIQDLLREILEVHELPPCEPEL